MWEARSSDPQFRAWTPQLSRLATASALGGPVMLPRCFAAQRRYASTSRHSWTDAAKSDSTATCAPRLMANSKHDSGVHSRADPIEPRRVDRAVGRVHAEVNQWQQCNLESRTRIEGKSGFFLTR
jgi:hypothetical protein